MPRATTPMIDDPDTTLDGVTLILKEGRYAKFPPAQLEDDGIIDPIAVERFTNGDSAVRMTPREIVVCVATLAARGETDETIAARFGRTDEGGKEWIHRMRGRHRIRTTAAFTDTYLERLLAEPSRRVGASTEARRAAGIVVPLEDELDAA